MECKTQTDIHNVYLQHFKSMQGDIQHTYSTITYIFNKQLSITLCHKMPMVSMYGMNGHLFLFNQTYSHTMSTSQNAARQEVNTQPEEMLIQFLVRQFPLPLRNSEHFAKQSRRNLCQTLQDIFLLLSHGEWENNNKCMLYGLVAYGLMYTSGS